METLGSFAAPLEDVLEDVLDELPQPASATARTPAAAVARYAIDRCARMLAPC
jgi:hypothetical protein